MKKFSRSAPYAKIFIPAYYIILPIYVESFIWQYMAALRGSYIVDIVSHPQSLDLLDSSPLPQWPCSMSSAFSLLPPLLVTHEGQHARYLQNRPEANQQKSAFFLLPDIEWFLLYEETVNAPQISFEVHGQQWYYLYLKLLMQHTNHWGCLPPFCRAVLLLLLHPTLPYTHGSL